MKTEAQIALFLSTMKQFVEKNGFIFVDRAASNKFLSDRNMTLEELQEIILSLSVSDCFDGPEPDRDPRYAEFWTVAEFSPALGDDVLYLKMSLRMDAERVKCLSVKLFSERRSE